MIHVRPIEGSSQIQGIGYDESMKILRVQFISKKPGPPSEYDYFGVEPEVHDKFVKAQSKGKFLYAEIKPKYPVKKVS